MASKNLERLFVDEFVIEIGQDFQVREEREASDFVLSSGNSEFGLEVVQLFRDCSPKGSSSKKLESQRNKFLRRVASHYYRSSGLPIHVQATLPSGCDIDVQLLSDRLKEERCNTPWEWCRFTVEPNAKFRLGV